MLHAVIYHPEVLYKDPDTLVSAEKLIPNIKDCVLRYCWKLKAYKEASIWYAYLSDAELAAIVKAGDCKCWTGATAREAWKAAYASGLEIAREVVEQSITVPVQLDGKEKYITAVEAKSIGQAPNMDAELLKTGHRGLPLVIFGVE